MEIRAIIGKDGEEYLNAKDLLRVLFVAATKDIVPNLAVFNFVRRFAITLITARRE
jgi:hypothetical protein